MIFRRFRTSRPWLTMVHYSNAIKIGLIMAAVVVGLVTLIEIQRLGEMNTRKLDELVSTYAPLVFDQTQNVVREPPVFHLNEPVAVEADFKNTDSVPVSFTGAVHWRLVSPDRKVEILQFEFNGTVPPGCKEFKFQNLPPAEVITLTQRLFKDGYDSVTWEIYGDNVIVSPQAGNTLAFHVEQFRYIPDDRPLPETRDIHTNTQCENL